MEAYESLSHSRYDCKYHVVFCPKFRKKSLFGEIRQYLKGVLSELAKQKGSKIISGHMALDHVHMCITIPPKYAVAESDRIPERKKRHSRGKAVWRQEKELPGREFVGSRIRCLNGGV